MYASVVVLTYQSPDIDYYTYKIPEELEDKVKIGQLVSVPFGKRNPIGLILDTRYQKPETKISIKPISSIILEKPILLPYQIKLLKWMSTYYIAPMVNCLEAMLPELPSVKRLSLNSTSYQPASPAKRGELPVTSYQTLVLAPSINHLPQTLAQFPQAKNHAVYTNELKTSERFTVWQKILSGNCDFIFGSRSAIFAPSPNLKKIIIFDEHDGAYKDSRSPYFDTLTVAEKISELTQAKIEIFDSSPRVTTFTNHKEDITFPVTANTSNPLSVNTSMSLRAERSNLSVNSAKQSREHIASSRSVIKNGARNDKTDLPQTKIISLANDRKLGNYSPISLTLEEIIKRAYSKKLSILLFLNKKIESGSIYCKNCKHQEFFKSQPEICPNCKSTEIFFNSTNINSLAREIKKILPDSTINIFADGLKSTVNGQVSIVTITTSSVFYKLLTKKYDLAVHIYADSPLNFNEYNSTEEIYSQIINLKKLTRKLLIIQTYNEELPAIKFATSGNYEAFYKSELAPRKILNYPPYALLVKISVTGKTEIDVEKKSQQIYKDISTKLPVTSNLAPITLLGPYKVLHQKTLSYNITLKIPLDNHSLPSREKAIDKFRKFFSKQKDVRIIVEPKNLNQ